MLHSNELNKQLLDDYLRQLGKKYRKKHGKGTPAEIILIGGASCIINYGFREITTDVDALILAASSMKDAIKEVALENNLSFEWLNEDFKNTKSYTPNIRLYSEYYKEFSNCLTVRCVTAEYLLAMKLMSYRYYKNDISDIVGIIREQKELNNPITLERLETAIKNLYGDEAINTLHNNEFVIKLLSFDAEELDNTYNTILTLENHNKSILLESKDKPDNEIDIYEYLKSNDGYVDFGISVDDDSIQYAKENKNGKERDKTKEK